jgi:hypothetical protein
MTDKTETPAETAEQSNTTAAPEETQMTDDKTGAAETQTRAAETKPKAKPAPDPAPEDCARGARHRRAGQRSPRAGARARVHDPWPGRQAAARAWLRRRPDQARRLHQRGAPADPRSGRGQGGRDPDLPHVSIPLGGRDATVTRREAISSALLHRYSPTLFPLEDAAREYRGMTLMELARESLETAGANTRGLSRDEVATRALHSTSDFPEILVGRHQQDAAPGLRGLSPHLHAVLPPGARHRLQGDAPGPARRSAAAAEVGESGEFKRGTLGESKESYKVKTYGRVVAITRQTLINDDLDAFTRIPAMYGNSIAQLESDVVWGIITANPAMADGNALFHTTHKNLAGTGAALDVGSVGAARAAMAKQTGLDKKTVLNVRPAFLIVPASLELKAEQLVAQNLVPAATSSVVPQSIRTLAPISEPRLDAASETAWYLAASAEPDRHHRVRLSRGPAGRLHRDPQRLRRRRRRDQVPPRLRREGHRLARPLQEPGRVTRFQC